MSVLSADEGGRTENKNADEDLPWRELTGDLFACSPEMSLAHCISADCRMGKGIAALFKKKFGGLDSLKEQVQKAGGTKNAIGTVAVLERGGRFVYYLITKQFCYEKPMYEHLQSSLERLCRHAVQHGVKNVAMPRIGCGLDGLEWPKVAALIQETFQHVDVNIAIYSL